MPPTTSLPSYTSSFPYSSATIPGVGAFGSVPMQIGVPPSTYQQAVATNPQLAANSQDASSFINSELLGQLSPATMAQLQDNAASWNAGSGLGFGSGIGKDSWDTSRLLATIGYQQHGLGDLQNYQSGLEAGMTNPALAAQIAAQNSIWASSPDPTMVHQELQNEASKGQVGKAIGSAIGGLAGFAFGGHQGASALGNIGGEVGYTAGGGVANPGAGVGSYGFNSSLGQIGSGTGSSPVASALGYGSPSGVPGSSGAGSASQGAYNWWQNPSSDPYNALNQGPGGGTGAYSDPFSSLGGTSNDAEGFQMFSGMV